MVILAALIAAWPATPPAVSTIADAARPPVTSRDLVEVADIMGPRLSPDGTRILYRVSQPSVEANDTRLDWYIADIDSGSPIHAGSAGTVRHDGAGSVAEQRPIWDPDSRGFRFLGLIDGVVAIWHWREGEGLRREIVDPANIVDFSISVDGNALRYTVGATRAEVVAAQKQAYEGGVLVDDSVDLGQAVAGGKIEGGRRIMQRWTRNWFDRAQILWDATKTDRIVDLSTATTSAKPPIFIAPPPRQSRSINLPDGSRAAIEGARDATRLVVTRADGSRLVCAAAVCRSPRLAAIGARPGYDELLLFEEAESARERVWRWRIGDREAKLFTATDGAMRVPIWQDRCEIARAALICAESMPTSPPQLVRIDFVTGRRIVLADPNAELRRRIDAVATPVHWANGHDGILLKPRGAHGPLPLVIQYYRCDGFLKGGVGDEIPMLPLVEHGIAVLCMVGKAPVGGNDTQASYGVALDAIGTTIDGLAAAGEIDPDRVGLGGLSFGATVVIWAIRKSDRFAAATISSGLITPHYYWSNAIPDRGFVKKLHDFWQIGNPEDDPDRWRLISPVWDIAALDTPLLMQVPESEVRNLVELHTKLKLAGKPAELFAFADEIHVKYQPAHKRAVYERNLDWYRFWLKDEEDSDPAKTGQYVRWNKLRAARTLPASAR